MLDDAHAQHDIVARVERGQVVADVVEVVHADARFRKHASGAREGRFVGAILVDGVDGEPGAGKQQREIPEVRAVVEQPAGRDTAPPQRRRRVDHAGDAAVQVTAPIERLQRGRAA